MPVLEAPPPSASINKAGKISDAECFSDRTDKFKDEAVKCVCGADAVGGTPSEFKQSVVNKTIGLFRFLCASCRNGETFAVTAAIMYPTWKIVIEQGPGLYWLRHLNEKEQVDRLNGTS